MINEIFFWGSADEVDCFITEKNEEGYSTKLLTSIPESKGNAKEYAVIVEVSSLSAMLSATRIKSPWSSVDDPPEANKPVFARCGEEAPYTAFVDNDGDFIDLRTGTTPFFPPTHWMEIPPLQEDEL